MKQMVSCLLLWIENKWKISVMKWTKFVSNYSIRLNRNDHAFFQMNCLIAFFALSLTKTCNHVFTSWITHILFIWIPYNYYSIVKYPITFEMSYYTCSNTQVLTFRSRMMIEFIFKIFYSFDFLKEYHSLRLPNWTVAKKKPHTQLIKKNIGTKETIIIGHDHFVI